MTVIGIDPAYRKEIAFAVWQSKNQKIGGKEKWNLLLTGKSWEPAGLLDVIKKSDIVIIEDQYLGPNVEVQKQLSRVVGEIIGICKDAGIIYVMMNPSTWQSTLNFKYGKKPKEMKPSHWKKEKVKYLIDFASDLIGSPLEDEDISAAVLIGRAGVEDED